MGLREQNVYALYGQQKFGGNMVFPLFPSMGAQLLAGWFGTDAITGTGPYTHTLTGTNLIPSFTVEKNVGGYESEQYAGCRVSKYEIRCPATNQAVQASVDFVGKSSAVLTTPTTTSYVNEAPFVFAQGTVTLFGQVNAAVTNVVIALDNKVKDTHTVTNSHAPQFITPQERNVNGTFDVVFNSLDDANFGYFNKLINGTQGTLILALSQGASASATITLQQINLARYTDDIKLGDVILTSLSFEASYSFSNTETARAVVVNSTSTAYAP